MLGMEHKAVKWTNRTGNGIETSLYSRMGARIYFFKWNCLIKIVIRFLVINLEKNQSLKMNSDFWSWHFAREFFADFWNSCSSCTLVLGFRLSVGRFFLEIGSRSRDKEVADLRTHAAHQIYMKFPNIFSIIPWSFLLLQIYFVHIFTFH